MFFVLNFAEFVRTPFLQNTTRRLLLIIAVSIVVKGELANENVNYDTKTRGSEFLSYEIELRNRVTINNATL